MHQKTLFVACAWLQSIKKPRGAAGKRQGAADAVYTSFVTYAGLENIIFPCEKRRDLVHERGRACPVFVLGAGACRCICRQHHLPCHRTFLSVFLCIAAKAIEVKRGAGRHKRRSRWGCLSLVKLMLDLRILQAPKRVVTLYLVLSPDLLAWFVCNGAACQEVNRGAGRQRLSTW